MAGGGGTLSLETLTSEGCEITSEKSRDVNRKKKFWDAVEQRHTKQENKRAKHVYLKTLKKLNLGV